MNKISGKYCSAKMMHVGGLGKEIFKNFKCKNKLHTIYKRMIV